MHGMGYWGANPQGGDTVPKDMAQNMGFIILVQLSFSHAPTPLSAAHSSAPVQVAPSSFLPTRHW
jgi:hypothetical protein